MAAFVERDQSRTMKRKAKGKKPDPTARKPQPPSPDATRAMIERSMADITRLIEQQDFKSEAELNAFLQQHVVGQPLDNTRSTAATAAQQAQDLVWEAWATRGRRERIRLAEQALELSPDCADAYALLASEKATTLAEAKALYEAAVRAGERTLGEETFRDDVGHFWGLHKTRPYMRARAGLAQILWELGEHDAASAHYRELLRLNPQDNQGIRYLLLDWLLSDDRDEEAGRLLDENEDEASAHWLYSRALWLFRRRGQTEWSDAALRDAIAANRHVPAYLLGNKRLPKSLPEYITVGDASEAHAYAVQAAAYWARTPGALAWLATRV